ncbi:MAG: HlyC/CorC family transporter, partial [Lachnospiraceae bacterium]|nr:HlyC/CorC family transporter [Lachnospiraceae bacterium]
TIVILLFGEITPKTLATVYADQLSLFFCVPVSFLMKVLTPVIVVVNTLSGGLLRLFRVDPNAKADTMTEEELRTIVDVSHEDGVIEKDERNMIKNVVDFGDSQAKDIMVPRIDMTLVDVDATYEELMEIFRKDKFTRLPVYEEAADNVIGIINMKDILLYRPGEQFSIRDYLRKAYYTYEYKKTAELLSELRAANASIAIVLDEYGTTAGLVTLEDLLEEIVGDIRDEYDDDETDEFSKVTEKEFLVEGSTKLDDVNDELGLQLESEDYDTIGGFVIGLLDHLPVVGESTEFERVRFIVEQMQKKRIETIRVILPEPVSEEAENEKESN